MLNFTMISPGPKLSVRGFTLMELMIVLAVMGVMMGMIGFSLSGGGGAALQASQRQLLGLVQQTRAKAALYGRPARLIVSIEEEEEKFYRYMEIIVQDANKSSQWVVQGEGKYLEDGVYLLPLDDSKVATTDNWSELAYSVWSHDSEDTMKLNDSFKGVREEGGTQAFNYLEFNAEGNLVCSHRSDSSTPTYPRLVLANGSLSPGGEKLLRFDDVNSVAGIMLRRFGGYAVLDSNDFGVVGGGSSSGNGY